MNRKQGARVPISRLLALEDVVLRTARSLAPNTAEDILQDVRVEMLTHPPGNDGNLRGWLAAVTRSACAARRMASTRRQDAESIWVEARREAVPRQGLETEELETMEDDRALVAAALERLAVGQSEVVHLRFQKGLNIHETAQALGIPSRTVRSRAARALEHLRRIVARSH